MGFPVHLLYQIVRLTESDEPHIMPQPRLCPRNIVCYAFLRMVFAANLTGLRLRSGPSPDYTVRIVMLSIGTHVLQHTEATIFVRAVSPLFELSSRRVCVLPSTSGCVKWMLFGNDLI